MKVIFCWKQTKTETGKIIRRGIKPVYHICLTLICLGNFIFIFNYLPEVDFNIIKNVKGLDLHCRTYNQNKEGLRPLTLEAICYLYD